MSSYNCLILPSSVMVFVSAGRWSALSSDLVITSLSVTGLGVGEIVLLTMLSNEDGCVKTDPL